MSIALHRKKTLTVLPPFLNPVFVVGGPGAGKRELAAGGYATVEESARAIIAERVARGDQMLLLSLKRSCVETLRSTSVSLTSK